MNAPLEAAYASSVIIANGLGRFPDQSAAHDYAVKLKDALGKAVAHPNTVAHDSFQSLWSQRASQFGAVNVHGELGNTIQKHIQILQATTL